MGENSVVRAASFSPDGGKVLIASGSENIHVFNADSGMCCLVLVGHHDWVRAASFSPDGLLIASASYDGTARVWSTITGECLQTLTGHTEAVVSVEVISS